MINIYMGRAAEPVKTIVNDPAVIVFFADGDKIVTKCQDGDEFDATFGYILCLLKKAYGKDIYNKHIVPFMEEQERQRLEELANNPFAREFESPVDFMIALIDYAMELKKNESN